MREAERFTGGTTIPRLSTSALANIQIPILPLLDLQKFGDSHIEKSSNEELFALQAKLESKSGRIFDLEQKVAALSAVDAENEKLGAEKGQLTALCEDRLQKIEAQRSTNDLRSKIAHGETRQLEFKTTLRWNIKANRDDEIMQLMVLKTIAAFCNTDGGELLIGVSDTKEILGLDLDHFPDSDKFLLHLRNLIVSRFSACLVQDVHYEIVSMNGKAICHVLCKKRKGGVWVKTDKSEIFYVRDGPSSTELPNSNAASYIHEHLRE